MKEQGEKYMVCTRCFTYNQAPYIVDAMNGFAMQETTFPVVSLIVDDASTDGEPDVIRKYISENFQKPFRNVETDDAFIICDHVFLRFQDCRYRLLLTAVYNKKLYHSGRRFTTLKRTKSGFSCNPN